MRGNVLVLSLVCDPISYICSNRIYPGIPPRGTPIKPTNSQVPASSANLFPNPSVINDGLVP